MDDLIVQECVPRSSVQLADFFYPEVEKIEWALPDKGQLLKTVQYCISSANALCLVVKNGSQVVGGVAVSAERIPWAQKRFAQIHMLSGANPGIVNRLINEVIKWVLSRRGILVISYNFPVQTIAMDLLLQHGFSFEGSVLLWRRYNGLSEQNIQAT